MTTESFFLARPLVERGRPSLGEGDEVARARRDRWRAQPPFAGDHWWRTRLDSAGIDEPQLLGLLAEGNDDLAARLPALAWESEFHALIGQESPAPAEAPAGVPFIGLVRPLLHSARARLLKRLKAISGFAAAYDADELTDQLYAPLPAILSGTAIRVLIFELNVARLDGRLHGADARERFSDFSGKLSQPRVRRAIFSQYPVLARQLMVEFRAWLAGSERFARHLVADQARLGSVFGGGAALGKVCQVAPGLGDRHRGGATVTAVRWSSGLRLVYKPRQTSVDEHFQELARWLNGHGFAPPLATVTCLNAGDHGWMEFVESRPCDDEAARHRFYHRQGGLLALLYLLGANDFHAENIIAAGEHPVLVDLETLMQPVLPAETAGLTDADVAASEATRDSVVTSGLLPRRTMTNRDGRAVDLSGLGLVPGQRSPLRLPMLRDLGQDTMRLELDYAALPTPAHRPVEEGGRIRLLDYADDVLGGLTQAYQICAKHRDELDEGPLASFAGDEVRVLLRATMWYDTILRTSFHPDLLRDALDRERHFDALWREAPRWPMLAAVAEAERADLWRNDIPLFTATTTGSALLDSGHHEVKGPALISGLERARARLAALGPADLERQRWFALGSIGTSMLDTEDDATALFRRPGVAARARGGDQGAGAPAHAAPFDTAAAIAAADAIGRQLRELAFSSGDSAQWLGINSLRGRTWSLGPLQADLYHGLTGVALFLAQLGRLTGEAGHEQLARAAIRTVLSQLESGLMHRMGGLAGSGGVIYGLAELGSLWGEDQLLTAAQDQARLAGQAHGQLTESDFTVGLAGSLAGLTALHHRCPSDWLGELIGGCAGQLLEAAVECEEGLGWPSQGAGEAGRDGGPVVGFGHGAAGILGPLFQAAELTGEDRYRQAALRGLAFEQARYDLARGIWLDPGESQEAAISRESAEIGYWCYGAIGIGLSRLCCLRYTGDDVISRHEITTALARLGKQQRGTHCLCHGDAGNLELYLHAAEILGQPAWLTEAENLAGQILADHDRGGWVCGTALAVPMPGLMTGLAGIGYGLLRAAAPAQIPAVLTLAPARSAPLGSVRSRAPA